uniref:Ribosome biogenesis protein slx9-like n=1 Tax=Zea mays TaxID=4577 RepID=A0A804QQP1_MAIZE
MPACGRTAVTPAGATPALLRVLSLDLSPQCGNPRLGLLGDFRWCSSDVGALKKNTRSRRQKKLKAYDLSALSESLPEPCAPKQKPEAKLNCKSRQTLVLREAAHLKVVLGKMQFQLDPFAAIHQHLLATQPPAAAKGDAVKQGKDSKNKKRRKKGASSSSQAMDI